MSAFPLPAAPSMYNSWGLNIPGAEILAPLAPANVSPLTAYMPKVEQPQSFAPAAVATGAQSAAGPLAGLGQAASAQGLGMNMPTANLALSGLQTLGNLWAAYEQNKLAKKQFAYTREITDTNLANSIRSYNTSLTDRITARAHTQGMSNADRDAYIAAHSARRGA